MKKILLFTFLSFWITSSFGQKQSEIYNAYTLAKAMSAFDYQESGQKDSIAINIVSHLMFYSSIDVFDYDAVIDKIRTYPALIEKFNEITRHLNNSIRVIVVLDSLDKINQTLKVFYTNGNKKKIVNNNDIEILERIDTLYTKLKASRKALSRLNSDEGEREISNCVDEVVENFKSYFLSDNKLQIDLKGDSLQLFKEKLQVDSVWVVPIIQKNVDDRSDTIVKQSEIDDFYNRLRTDLIQYLIDTKSTQLTREITKRTTEIKTKFHELSTSLKTIFNGMKIVLTQAKTSNTIEEQIRTSQQTVTYNEIAAPQASSISFKMPSEADMIEALAIYLASRIKQEAVLWFFDELRKNTDQYELISTAFPETMGLLQSEEVYSTPNLGPSWKYALSKDFVKMPKHILESEWLKTRIPDSLQGVRGYLSIAWDISRYVNQNFSYRDIISQLYLDKDQYYSADREGIHIEDMLNILYALTNELNVKDTVNIKKAPHFRSLSYTELRHMTTEEMLIMMSLLDLKYGKSFSKVAGKLDVAKIDYNKKERLAEWMGKTLLTVSQFEKILLEIKQARGYVNGNGNGEEKLKPVKFDHYNVWNLMSEVLNTLLPSNNLDLTNTEIKTARYNLRRLEDAFEVYNLLEQKNYTGAASKVLILLDTLLYRDSLIVNTKKIKFPNNLISIELNSNELSRFKEGEVIYLENKNMQELLRELNGVKNLDRKVYHSRKIKVPKDIIFCKNLDGKDSVELDNKDGSDRDSSKKRTHKLLVKSLDNSEFSFKLRMNKKNLNHNKLLKEIFDEYEKWGGVKRQDTLYHFPVESVAASILASNDQKALQMVRKLSNFLGDVALTQDSKDLKKVIESYALPPGSYKQKRNTWGIWTINAFVGVYSGYEEKTSFQISQNNSSLESLSGAWVYGLSAPIGVSYSFNFGKRVFAYSHLPSSVSKNPDILKIGKRRASTLSNWVMTFTASVVDIGAVVSFRLKDNDNALSQQFKWEQFISPGFHAALAIKNTPLVLQAGIQITPQIRRVDETGEGFGYKSMYRSYIGVFFDLPLYTISVRTRNVKHCIGCAQ